VRTRADAFIAAVRADTNDGRLTQKMAVASLPSGTLVYLDRVTANREVMVTEARGLPVGIENDPVSGNFVRLFTANGEQVRRGGAAGDLPVPGGWANVDDRLGVVSAAGPMVYRSAGKPNRPGAREDILYGALVTAPRAFHPREEVVRRAMILLPDATAAQTKKVAATVRLDRGDIGTSVSFHDVDGAERMVSLQDDGQVYVPGLTPEPK
jgi:hypothetical protein